jgi:hypothetical protein
MTCSKWLCVALIGLALFVDLATLFNWRYGGPSGYFQILDGTLTYRIRTSDPPPEYPWQFLEVLHPNSLGAYSFATGYVANWKARCGQVAFLPWMMLTSLIMGGWWALLMDANRRRAVSRRLVLSFCVSGFLAAIVPHSRTFDVSRVVLTMHLASLCLATYFVRALVERRGFKIGHCQLCDYNLTANVSGICPECGSKIDPRWLAPSAGA